MSAATLVAERLTMVRERPPVRSPAPVLAGPDDRARLTRSRRAMPVLVLVGGLISLAAAGAVPFPAPAPGRPAAPARPGRRPRTDDPWATTVSDRECPWSPRPTSPARRAAGNPRRHRGHRRYLGDLTVYDSDCRAQIVERGRPYVGGQQPHLARSETASPVEMTVTHLSRTTPTNSTRHVPPGPPGPLPAGCTVGQA